MGVLRSFAIRKEFESFCSIFKIANERRPALYWWRSEPESADAYLDCLMQIHEIFTDSLNSSDRLKYTKDCDYHAYEERIIRLICSPEKFGYGNRECFRKEMMSEQGRESFQRKVSILPGVRFLEMLAIFFFREKRFWASWVTNFVCFMSHIHQLREWLMENKRCVAAFGLQKVGKSRFWKNSLGIETNPSLQSHTVQTQMWMLPYSQFIDFPAFSEENVLGESYNGESYSESYSIDRFIRCDILARDIVYDFLLVPDVCVYIVKIDSINIKQFIARIEDLEMNRYPAFYDQPPSRSGLSRAGGYNRLARESFLLCSHTQNFICRMQPVISEDVDRESLTAAELKTLTQSQLEFAWVCGSSDGFDERGHAVKIIEKIQVDGKTMWKVVDSERDVWQRLRTKLEKKKRSINEMFSNKNVFLAYFAEYQSATDITPYSQRVVNHIDEDFPWFSAFCESTGNLNVAAPRESDVDADLCYGDLPILNASRSLDMIMRRMFTSKQLQLHNLDDVISRILLRHSTEISISQSPDQRTCDVCFEEDYVEVHSASMQCNECNLFMCGLHAEQHKRRRANQNHNVVNVINVRRNEEEISHPNSRTNREMRLKIWQFQRQNIAFRGQTMIDELCGDAGLIKALLKSLKYLRVLLAFDLSAFESSNGFGIGVAFWSYLMGDAIFGRTFYAERIKWRSVETTKSPSKTKRFSLDFFSEPHHQTPEDLMQKFILDVNTLWDVVKCGGDLKSEISKITAQDSQKMPSSARLGSGIVHGTNSSCVPWFSAIFFRMLQEVNFPDFVLVVFDGLCELSNGNRAINSQEFCLSLIKIILLPMLASKKFANSSLTYLRELQYGDGNFFSSFFYLEKAMFECRDPRIISNRRPLVDLFSIQSASEDQTNRYVEAISSLLRCVTVKGLIELSEAECLDFQSCIPNLACERMYRTLCESRSAFAFNYSLLFAGTSGFTNDQLLKSMIESTELAFVKMELWVLKPMLEIQAKIGQHWRSVSDIASQEKFKDVFKTTRTVAEQYVAMKRRMHDLADGSYAAVTVSIHNTMLTDLNNPSMGDGHYFDIPLMGRTIMGIGRNDIVRCFLTEPSLCSFECKVQCSSFESSNETYKERQFLRISFDTLRSMKIEMLPECSSFTFILSNCSAVFFEELHPQAIGPIHVIWTDLSLVQFESGSLYPRPFHDCKVELKPLIPEKSAFACDQLSEVPPSNHCIVGQLVMMHISFHPAEPLPIRRRTRILVVLDNDFDYTTPKSPTLTIWPFNKETPYVITYNGIHALMEVWFNPGDELHKGCITLSFPAKNPCGERLQRKACFIYLRNENDSYESPHFVLQSLGCGIASTPKIHRMPLQMNSEILISKALLSENNVDLMLTFECTVDFLVHVPASNLDKLSTSSIIEINFPKSWDCIAKDDQPLTLCVSVNGVQTDLPVELHEISQYKISVRIQQEYRVKCKMSEGSKCSLVIRGIRLPPQSDEFRVANEQLKEAFAALKEKKATAESLQNDQSKADYEDSEKKKNNARSQLSLLKEKLTAGCSVTIKDASQNIVMGGHNVSMSPFFDDEQQFATTIQRRSFEESEFKKANDKVVEWDDLNTANFWTRFNRLMNAFVKQYFSSEKATTHLRSLDAYQSAIDKAFAAHVQKKIEKPNGEPVQDCDPASRVAALAIQVHFLSLM
jgi:hypothetical protein